MDFLDPEAEGLVKAREMVKLFTASRGVREEDLSLPSLAIVTFSPRMLDGLVEVSGGRRLESWRGRNPMLFLATMGDRTVLLAKSPYGAPTAVVLLEELAAFGVSRAVYVGYCGSIREEVGLGEIVLPSHAVREDGTSYHYLPGTEECRPDRALLEGLQGWLQQRGMIASVGGIWTTDALYRETVKKVRRYREEGVLAVDMEMSALFAAGAIRGVGVVGVLLVSDQLFDDGWTPGFFHPRLLEMERAINNTILEWVEAGEP